MKRILLNTALATVLYLSNAAHASDDHRDDSSVRSIQSLTGQALPSTSLNELPEEIITHILSFSKLKDLGRFSQASHDCQRLAHKPISIEMSKLDKIFEHANPHVKRPLSPQFTHLLKSISTGDYEFNIYCHHPSSYVPGSTTELITRDFGARRPLKNNIHGIDDNGKFILKKDVQQHQFISHQCNENAEFYHTNFSSANGNKHADSKPNHDVLNQAYLLTVNPESQHSGSMQLAAGMGKAYIEDVRGNQTPVAVESFEFLEHPEGVIASQVLGISSDGQSIFGYCTDSNYKADGFIWTHENGMKKLVDVMESSDKNVQLLVASPKCITDNGEMLAGFSRPSKQVETFASIFVGPKYSTVSLQKLLELGSKQIPEHVHLEKIEMMSKNGKFILGQASDKPNDERLWFTAKFASKENLNTNNDLETLSTN